MKKFKKRKKESENPLFCPYLENHYYRGASITYGPEVRENIDNLISTQDLRHLLEALKACQGSIIYKCANKDEFGVHEDNAHEIVEKEIDWLRHIVENRHPDSKEARKWLTKLSSTINLIGKRGPVPWPKAQDDILGLLKTYERIRKELKHSGVISKPKKEKLDNTNLRFKALKHFFQNLTIDVNKKICKYDLPNEEELKTWSDTSAVSEIALNVMSHVYKRFFSSITMSPSKLEKLLVQARGLNKTKNKKTAPQV